MPSDCSVLNHPPKTLPGPEFLHELIDWTKNENDCAIDFTSYEKRSQYSYAEVRSCVASLSSRIQRALSEGPTYSPLRQPVIPLLLPQCPGLYISQIAILESGGAFCPINLDAPQERIKFVVGDVSAQIVITTSEFKGVASWENGPRVIVVDEFPVASENDQSKSVASYNAKPTDLAYVMYTSGSSGTPKGVAVSHLAASQSLMAHQKHIPQFKRFLQFAAPSFDVSVFEIFFPLVRGSTLVGCNRSQLLNDLPGMITSLEIDAAELTPTVAGSLLQRRANAPCLKLLLTIGEMLTRPIIEEFGGSETRESMLYGMYGPTEAAIHCNINPAMASTANPSNIGIPLETVSNFVATAAKSPEDAQKLTFLPIGEIGELVLSGPQLAQGYLNRDEQNRAAFVKFEGCFYYRTGDKARMFADGTVEIHGRISAGQVKIRGQRVELGEIEEAVFRHAGIKTVVAAVLGSVLIVFALTEFEETKPEDVVKTCSKWLPKFMVPSEVVLLQEFPYLPSGKVDKRRLEADYQQQRQSNQQDGLNLLSETENTLRNLLQELLGPFPSNTRLAAAGLDSLQAIRVSSKLRTSGFNVSTVSVLQADTLQSLARMCDESPWANQQQGVVQAPNAVTNTYESDDIEAIFSCTSLQSSMLAETAVNNRAYKNWVELQFPGIADSEHVVAAFRSLTQKNSILRTSFLEPQNSGEFRQIVWRIFPETQIVEVDEFDYSTEQVVDFLRYPVRVQILKGTPKTRLLLHIHHALYDAWALELMLDDFNSLLKSIDPPPRQPFANLVSAYQDGIVLPNKQLSKDYWSDHMAHIDIRKVPNFHSGKKPSPELCVHRLQTSISTSSVEAKARQLSSSAQALFQSAYSLILGSYVGSPDVCFGSVFSGRTLPVAGIEDMAGPCLSTLPVRIDVSTSSKLQELVFELNATTRKHMDHSALPLRDIKSAAGVQPGQPLFDTLLIWQQTLHPYDHNRENVALVETVDNLEFDLTIEIIPGTGNIELKANFQRSIFPSSQVEILLSQLEYLVQTIIEDEATSIGESFGKLPTGILSVENEEPDVEIRSGTLASPVERLALEEPSRPAIEFATQITSDEFESHKVSYGELNVRANQIYHLLMEEGVLPDELVCICMEKCVDLYASILATSKISAGYLPITPDTPVERLEHILKEANVKHIITTSSSSTFLAALPSVKVHEIDRIDFANFSTENPQPTFSPENISYCVFTSGSTGTPKGVLVTHGNLLSNLDVLEDLYPKLPDPRLLQSCSQAFDVSVFEIFFTWRIGGCICSATKDVLFRDIGQAIRVLNVSHLSLTPTVAALINPDDVPSVKFLVTAGEAVTQKVFSCWAERGLYQGYGPSETTNICTVNPRVSLYDSINNIGRPFKNTSAFVLHPVPDFSLVPRGGEGEFCFGGAQVFRGYMNKEQESGRIIQHPKFGRLYRSGDFGRLMPDGTLAFTGRKDDQVKVRGQRVELGEINSLLLKSSEVGDCFTAVIEGPRDNSQALVCFWTSRTQQAGSFEFLEPDLAVILKLFLDLESALPSYMVPSSLIPVSHLPSTPQGKIDRRLLLGKYRALSLEYLSSTSKTLEVISEHSWTDLESEIAKCISDVTHTAVGDINPNSSFFSFGIDSISAIPLAAGLRKATSHEIQISDILKHSSIVRLAQRISSSDRSVVPSDPQTVVDSSFDFGFKQDFLDSTIRDFGEAGLEVERILPCTPLQEAMLSAAESSPKSFYSNEAVLNFSGDIERLQGCWSEMVRRHEILRTSFAHTEMTQFAYAQVVLKDFDLKFDRSRQEMGRFEPPYAIQTRTSGGSTKLVISMHHALYDAVALDVLYDEVERHYQGQTLPPTVSFAPFLRQLLSRDVAEADRFWEETLRGFLPSKLKSISPTAVIADRNEPFSRVQREIFPESYSWVNLNIKKHSTSLLAVCHAAWSSVLSAYLQETDICFGNVVSGRTVPVDGIERLVAPCFNTIPVRLSKIQNTSYLEAFRKLQNLNADSLPFQFSPLRRIQSKLSSDHSRMFDTLFILQQPARQLDHRIWQIEEDNGVMDFPLVCEVVSRQGDDVIEVVLHSHTCAISEEDASEILNSFPSSFRAALENPRRQMLSATVKDEIAEKKQKQEERVKPSSPSNDGLSREMSAAEISLRDIIAEFTDVSAENIGRDVSVFRLGLDSISTVQVASRLRKQGHNVLASDILEHPTIAQLAAHLSLGSDLGDEPQDFDFAAFDQLYRDPICAANSLHSERVESIRPCTAVQNGMIAQTLHSDGREYVNSVFLELLPHVSVSKFKATWNAVSACHEMLRTGFAVTGNPLDPFVMVTYNHASFALPWIEDENQSFQTFNSSQDLLVPPWNLRLVNHNGKTTVQFRSHHALYDAQSLQIIMSDFLKAYAGKDLGNLRPIAPLLGAILRANEAYPEAKKDFWQQTENSIIVNRFPDLTPLRVSDSSTSVREIFSKSSTAELEQICRTSGVTMQAAAQATWARVLAAYTGEPSTTFGMTLSGRSVHEDAENIAFPSIVTLPVRCNISGSNAELLQRTMSTNALLHKYQFTQLASIQKWARYSEGKIFDTLFAYQKVPEIEADVNKVWEIVREEATVDYVVSLEVQPTKSGQLVLRLSFRNNLVPAAHAELILRQYDELLLDTLQCPHNACDVVPDFGVDLLSITPANQIALPGPVSLLHEFVERGAREWPHKAAFEFATSLEDGNFQSRTWTYEQLNHESNKIANMLIDRDVFPGEIVGICFDKCAEASFAIIGILKAGCAYVALDPTAPIERLKFIADDSGARIIFTAGRPGTAILGVIKSDVIELDNPSVLANYQGIPPTLQRKVSPDDVSYCLYTSGTTGTPKGCLITHESAVQAMYAFQILFQDHWTPESKWLQFASFHFDVSVLEQFWSWSVGICVASAPRDLIFEDIPKAIQRLGITHIDLTPSLARILHPADVPSLCKGVFITGGEPLKQEILDAWGEHACIYNGYGPTEATIGVTMYPRVPRNGNPSNIGPAFENVGSFVLKPGTSLAVLRGGVGELCVSGKLVGKGYLNRPELTAEKFPTLENFNERVYRTGDLVRILHDGSFIFLGRADDQVKLRGQRLELSEINEVIQRSMVELKEVVTLVLRHATQQKEQLITFFVTPKLAIGGQEAILVSKMKTVCKSRLPGYMVPTNFIPIEKLPLNANNKADSKQLAAMYNKLSITELQELTQSSQLVESWTENEKLVISIIANLLQVEQAAITPSSNVFELGVDSISIIGFSHSLQTAGYKHAKLSLVKSNPSIDGLVKALLRGTAEDQGNESSYLAATQNMTAFAQRHLVPVCDELGVEGSEIEYIAPCTPMQEGMIYRFLESDGPLYFNKFAFELESELNEEALQSAWDRVIKNLQIMRTKFVPTDDGYAQVTLRTEATSFTKVGLNYDEIEKSSALKQPFSLSISSKPSFRIMELQVFHGLYDGNSLSMLLRRVIDEYFKLSSIDYGPPFYSVLLYGPLAQVSGARNFWTRHLEGWSSPEIRPTQNPTKKVSAALQIENLADFENLRRQLSVSHQSIIQAMWISVLRALNGSSVTLGLVISGRAIDFEGAQRVIGPLFNTVPFHYAIKSAMTAKELISTCHQFNMQMQDFQHTPLKDIQKWSPARPGESLFETIFVFERPEVEGVDLEAGVWKQIEGGQEVDYPLAFEVTLSPDSRRLGLKIIAQGSYITQAKAEDLLAEVEKTTLHTLANNATNIIEGSGQIPHELLKVDQQISKPTTPDTPSNSFPWTQQAERIRTEISGLANISSHSVKETSSIFELGLDSIDVIKLSSRLKKIGIKIPVSGIIKCQTISKMASFLSEMTVPAPAPPPGQLLDKMSRELKTILENNRKLLDVEDVLPATPLQQSMVNEMIRSGYKRYFNIDAFKIGSKIDPEQLKNAVKRVVDQSPILRTNFVQIEDPNSSVSFAQIIHKEDSEYARSIIKTRTTLSTQSIESSLSGFATRAIRSASRHGNLLQIFFVNYDTAAYMFMAISHALYDGTSLRVLHEDFSRAYQDSLSPRPDYQPFLEQIFLSTTDEAKNFWRTTVSNFPPSTVPRREVRGAPESQILVRRSRISLEQAEQLCRSTRITLQTLGQTCWALVLSKLMGQLDVVFGSVLSCRDTEEANEIMFPLMNTVAVRSVIHGTVEELLRHMQDTSDSIRQYQHFPLGTAQAYALTSRADQNITKDITLFDTLFIYQGHRAQNVQEPPYQSIFGSSDVEFPVCVEMEILDEKFLTWTTACKSTAAVQASEIIDYLETVLKHLISSPQSQTIHSNSEGTSVCGLPAFNREKRDPEIQRTPIPIIDNEGEWSTTEINIRRALHDLSKISEDNIKKTSTIFHLGLDSILILKLPALLKAYGIKLRVSDILREQTVADMAKAADRSHATPAEIINVDTVLKEASSGFNIEPYRFTLETSAGAIQEVIPVTAGQLFMIRQWQSSRGALFYPTFSFSIPGRVNKARLDRAWRILTQRHEILRTGFMELGSKLVQIVFRAPHNDVVYQIQGSPPMRRHDLSYPPINLILEEAKDVDAQLKLVIHHALYDGVTLPLIIQELQVLYRVEDLEPTTLKFRDFVAHSIFSASKPSTQQKWISYLQRDDSYSVEMAEIDNNRTEIFHPATPTPYIRQEALSTGVSVDALLLATIAQVHARSLQQQSPVPHVVIGIYHSNRAPFNADLSALCAPTLNLLPLIIRNPLDRAIAELARDVQIDLQNFSSEEMSSVDLNQIFEWTGVRVSFWVNILKDHGIGGSGMESNRGELKEFRSMNLEVETRAEVKTDVPNERIARGGGEAFIPSIDVELRYSGDKIDMGVFAPTPMLSIEDGERMVHDFFSFWS